MCKFCRACSNYLEGVQWERTKNLIEDTCSMKLAWLARIMMSHGLWLIWSCSALILFLSGEEIFILPLLFIAVALYELMSFCLGHITLWVMFRAFVWCACLAIF